MTIKVIFFDFDGTLADTLNSIVSITNRLAVEFGHKPISATEIARIKNLSSRQIIKQSGISILKFPLLVAKVKTELNAEIAKIQPFPDMKATLIELRKRADKIGILSSNSKENILAFLEFNEMDYLFDFIYTEAALFSKSRAIAKILKQEKILPKESVYIGDETRDIEAAKRSQVNVIAVSWGFNSAEILAQYHPDFLIQQPVELIEAIDRLQNGC
jgi:phosphoglycolate phosphatase-like HAD superfamily hydrolase